LYASLVPGGGCDALTYADGINAVFWLFMNKGRYFSTVPKTLLTILNVLIIGIAGCMVSSHRKLIGAANGVQCGLGLYVSGKAIHDNPSSASFSCASNA
jgi:hypothetical protein